MVSITEAIKAAETLGFLPFRNPHHTGQIPIGKKMWHHPVGQTITRNEDGKYVLYAMDGEIIATLDTKGEATMHSYETMEQRGVEPPASWQETDEGKASKPLPNLYCYNGPDGADPHEIKLLVSDIDRDKFNNLPKSREQSVVVTDINTGHNYRVRRTSCGAGCYCAAEAERTNDDI
jgi:hypothetical protein